MHDEGGLQDPSQQRVNPGSHWAESATIDWSHWALDWTHEPSTQRYGLRIEQAEIIGQEDNEALLKHDPSEHSFSDIDVHITSWFVFDEKLLPVLLL